MPIIEELEQYSKTELFTETLRIPKNSELLFALIGQGEYHINYAFTHPLTGQKLVLRLNTGSQMRLEKQIEYEYHALKILEASGRTAKAYYVDGSKKDLDFGVLVMEYLPGSALDYRKDLPLAAACLADIHSCAVPAANQLIRPEHPLRALLTECEEMAEVYFRFALAEPFVEAALERMIALSQSLPLEASNEEARLINTELNSGNFLINGSSGKNYLIDWEKPILGEVAQDIAHFLAPTTTFWKTDCILSQEEKSQFIEQYILESSGKIPTKNLRARVALYETLTCLRGICWCAMAWTQYQNPEKLICNPFTYQKIQRYLSEDFLRKIQAEYFAF